MPHKVACFLGWGECLVPPLSVVHGSGGTTKCLSSHYKGSDQARVIAVRVVMVTGAEW